MNNLFIILAGVLFSQVSMACLSSWEKAQVLTPTQLMREQRDITINDRDILVLQKNLFSVESQEPAIGDVAILEVLFETEYEVYYIVRNEGTLTLKKNGPPELIQLRTKLKPRPRCG